MPRSGVFKAGQVNMKGKKHLLMRCGCCEMIDHRPKELEKFHKQAIDEAINERKVDNGK